MVATPQTIDQTRARMEGYDKLPRALREALAESWFNWGIDLVLQRWQEIESRPELHAAFIAGSLAAMRRRDRGTAATERKMVAPARWP